MDFPGSSPQIDMLLRRRPELLVLAKHYGPTKFARHALRFMDSIKEEETKDKTANVVIIGGGLAGLTAALTILDGFVPCVYIWIGNGIVPQPLHSYVLTAACMFPLALMQDRAIRACDGSRENGSARRQLRLGLLW